MTNYYFVGVLLPELKIGHPPEISFREFILLLQDNLLEKDYALVDVLRRYYDLENLRSFWKKEELDPYGSLDKLQLEEIEMIPELLPSYVQNFLEKYENESVRLNHFPELMTAYFCEERCSSQAFLKEYLNFERKLRLIQTVFRAQYLKRDLLVELQYENPEESFIQQLVTQRDAVKFELPEEFQPLAFIFNEYSDSPIGLHKALCEFRFQKVADLMGNQPFSIDYILGYMIQLIIVERWENLDQEKGNSLVDLYIKENA